MEISNNINRYSIWIPVDVLDIIYVYFDMLEADRKRAIKKHMQYTEQNILEYKLLLRCHGYVLTTDVYNSRLNEAIFNNFYFKTLHDTNNLEKYYKYLIYLYRMERRNKKPTAYKNFIPDKYIII